LQPDSPDAIELLLLPWGTIVILFDDDLVFRLRIVQRPGPWKSVAGLVLIYNHKEQALHDVARHYPARHDIIVDGKLPMLAEAANGRPEVILIATGSEVHVIVEARQQLQKQDIQTRLVSMPIWQLFDTQTEEYRRSVFPLSVRTRLAVEAAATQGWHRYIGEWGDVIGLDHFGASAPAPVLMREFGFTVENVCKRALALLEKNNV
jgi:transketolase